MFSGKEDIKLNKYLNKSRHVKKMEFLKYDQKLAEEKKKRKEKNIQHQKSIERRDWNDANGYLSNMLYVLKSRNIK